MIKLFEQTNSGYSWSNRHTYYLCETEDEYNALLEQYNDHVNSWEEWNSMLRINVWRSNYKQVHLNTTITANAQTIVSDGFATHGGRNIKAIGITIKYCSNGLSSDYSSYEHYIKPNSVERDEVEKTESWWV